MDPWAGKQVSSADFNQAPRDGGSQWVSESFFVEVIDWMSNVKTKHFWITGRVQGVFYRASTETRAISLGLSGWVCNLADGRVEVVATGEEAALNEFEKWLWRGPENARVENIEANAEPLTQFERFYTRY